MSRGRAALGSPRRTVAMDRIRLTTSVQLLPALIGDPFGTGWDLLGPGGPGSRLRLSA